MGHRRKPHRTSTTAAYTHIPHSCSRQKLRRDPKADRKRRKRTPPHQEGHRHAGPFAAMPLQQHTPPDGMNNIGSRPLTNCLAVVVATTQRAGASPLPPLDSTSRVTSKRTRAGATPRPPQYSPPRIHIKGYRRSGEQRCPAPSDLRKPPSRHRRSTSSLCFTLTFSHRRQSSKTRKSLAPSSDVVPHRVAPAKLSNPSQSAASPVVERCRCRKRRPPTQSHAALTVARQRQPP